MRRFRNGPRIVVQIWMESPTDDAGNLSGDEVMYGKYGDDTFTGPVLDDLWVRCGSNAIPYDQYKKFLDTDYIPEKDISNYMP